MLPAKMHFDFDFYDFTIFHSERHRVLLSIFKQNVLPSTNCLKAELSNWSRSFQADNTEGILRVESGHARIVNCSFKCDGTGITVREGARLTALDCSISGAKVCSASFVDLRLMLERKSPLQGPAVELMAGSSAVLENNQIYCYSDEQDGDVDEPREVVGKGGVHLHVSNSLAVVSSRSFNFFLCLPRTDFN